MVDYQAAGSMRQPASQWQMRVFSASRRTPHSVHVRSPSHSNLELPHQTQGTVRCTPNSQRSAALRCAALRCAALRCAALRCAALRCAALRCAVLRCAFMWCTGSDSLEAWA